MTSPGKIVSRRELLLGGSTALVMASCRGVASETAALDARQFRKQGSTDREVLAAAFAQWQRIGGGTLRLEPDRTYRLGNISEGPDLFSIAGLRRATLDGNGASIVARSSQENVWNLLSFSSVENLLIRDMHFFDLGYSGETRGMKAIVLQPGSHGTTNVHLSGVVGESLLSLLQAQGPAIPNRVRAIGLGSDVIARNCYYAICCQNQGDNLKGTVSAVNCRRAYLVYGVTGHSIELHIEHDGVARASRSPILIKSYGRPTNDLSVSAHFSGSLPWSGQFGFLREQGACVSIEHQPQDGHPTVIEDIRLAVTIDRQIDDPYSAYLLSLTSIAGDAAVESATRNRWSRIFLAAHLGSQRGVALPTNPAQPFDLTLSGDVDKITVKVRPPNIRLRRAS